LAKRKFGVFLPFYALQKGTSPEQQFLLLKEIVLEAERLGFDSVWLDDHLMYEDWPILESWTTLSALVACTQKIRLGLLVSCNQHRNPALLAKAAATLDVLSNGRLEFGIGSGVQNAEHISYGFDFPEAKVRTEQLDEALAVITSLWTQPKANFQGKHYHLNEAICEPKPLQQPYPPITVGGSGEKHTLKVTAKYADRFDWGFLSVEEYKRKLAVLENHCKGVGRDFQEVERSCWPTAQIFMGKTQKEADEKILKNKPANMDIADFKKSTFAGTPTQFLDQMQVYLNLGATYFMLYFAELPRVDNLRIFAQEILS
jgi:F420-dependent oxidoreductase-like protein